MKLCNPDLCLYSNCNIRIKKKFCKRHINTTLNYIPYFINIDPFKIENSLYNFQYYWKNRILIRKNKFLIKNIKNLVNRVDPISQEKIIINKHLVFNLDYIYPLYVNNFMYIYKLNSLLQIINYNSIEIFTQTRIKNIDIHNIKYLCQKFNIQIQKDIITETEKNFFKKIDTLQKFDIIGTYFPVKFFDNIQNEKKMIIYKELKLMWIAFCNDNNISENDLYNEKIIWNIKLNVDNIEVILIDRINFLLNDNLEKNKKKMITYLIIGAFAYVDPEIKKIYNDFVFI